MDESDHILESRAFHAQLFDLTADPGNLFRNPHAHEPLDAELAILAFGVHVRVPQKYPTHLGDQVGRQINHVGQQPLLRNAYDLGIKHLGRTRLGGERLDFRGVGQIAQHDEGRDHRQLRILRRILQEIGNVAQFIQKFEIHLAATCHGNVCVFLNPDLDGLPDQFVGILVTQRDEISLGHDAFLGLIGCKILSVSEHIRSGHNPWTHDGIKLPVITLHLHGARHHPNLRLHLLHPVNRPKLFNTLMRDMSKLEGAGDFLLIFLGHLLWGLTQTAEQTLGHFLGSPTFLKAHLDHALIPNRPNLLIEKDRQAIGQGKY